MAIAAVAGIASALGAAAAQIGAAGFFATLFGTAGATAFAIGAGLSIVSRALAPKPNIGAQMRGITTTTREPASSRKIIYGRMRVGGQVVFISHSGDDNKYLNMAIAFATHEIEAYDEIWFNDNRIWDATNGFNGDWEDYVTIDRKFGTAGQAHSTQLVNSNVRWTTDHKLSGIAYIAFRLEWNADQFPQGVPNITAVIKGKKVYDPRTSTTSWSQNPALCLRDYMLDQSYGLGEVAAHLNDTSISDAADLCDEQVSLDGGGTQDRYQCNGVLDTANQIKANIEQLLSAMGGRLTYSGGEYFVNGAEYQAPTVTFTEADIVSDIQTQTKQSRRGIYNGVKGIFVSEEKNYKVLDYPAQISSTYEAEDGDPVYLDMPLPCVTNNTQAQRLAKIALLKSRQQVVMTMTTNLKGLRVKVGDTIQVTNDRLNYSSKAFEVIDYSLAITDGALGVNLTCIETAAALYDWNTSDEADFLSGGELPLYDGRTVDNVTNITFTEIGILGPDGGVNSAVELAWTAPDDAFIEFYTVQYNKHGTTDYFEVQTRETNALIQGLDITSNYDFTIKAQNLIGVRSAGITLSNRTLNGDTTAPSAPTSVATTGGIRNITATWNNPDDIDLKQIEVHVVDTNTTPAGGATPEAVITGEEYVYPTGTASAVTKYFFLRAVDYSGNKSAYTAGVAGTSLQVTGEDVGAGEIEARTLALLLNYYTDGVTPNSGEAALVGVNLDGTPNYDTDGFVLYDGEQITIEHDQYTNSTGGNTVLTSFIGKNGFIAFDLNKTQPFELGSGGQGSFGDVNCAFVWTEDDKWYYDTNDYISNATNLIADVEYEILTLGTTDFTAIGASSNTVGITFTATASGTGTGTAKRLTWPEFNPNSFTGTVTGSHYKTGTSTTTAKLVALGQLRLDEVNADTIVAGGLYADPMDITATEIPDNVITGRTIVVESITANKISGDISEVFSFGVQRTPLTLTSSEQTFATFDIPAPDADLTKYASLNATMQYTSNSPTVAYAIEVDFERKSKGTTTGTSIGTVVGSGTTSSFFYYVEVSGNVMTQLDSFGGIASSATSPSDIEEVHAVEYIQSTDRTRIHYADVAVRYTSGTIYYNADRWTSSGAWLPYATSSRRYAIPEISSSNFLSLTIHQPLAKSAEEETYRIRTRHEGFSGTSVSITSINGQIELLT